MKPFAYILNAMDFENFNDLLGTYYAFFPSLLTISLYVGIFGGFVETYFGISFMLWLFIAAASFFDIILGLYANVVYLGNDLETKRMFRGFFKALVIMIIIFLTNTFKEGVNQSDISPEILGSISNVISSTLHYSSVILTGLYILLGIAENGAKIEIPFCVSLIKILKMKIDKIEKTNEE